MITGISQADVAILVVSGQAGEFENGVAKNGQTREHALLAFTLGVKQMIVVCNKMDRVAEGASQDRFEEIKARVQDVLKAVGYNPEQIPFIPISSYRGDNMLEPSDYQPWYRGPTLLEALNGIKPPKRPVDKPLRLPLRDAYRIGGVGLVLVGRVETGALKPGMTVHFAPCGCASECKDVEMYHSKLEQALPGDNVGFNIKKIGVGPNSFKRGVVASDWRDDPAKAAHSFLAQLIIMNHPTQIRAGYTPVVHCHTANVACSFTALHQKFDCRSGKVLEESPQSIKSGDACLVTLTPTRPMCVEPFSRYPPLGRFVVRDMRATIAVGVVKAVTVASSAAINGKMVRGANSRYMYDIRALVAAQQRLAFAVSMFSLRQASVELEEVLTNDHDVLAMVVRMIPKCAPAEVMRPHYSAPPRRASNGGTY
eukprot:SAG31_NODE_5074_length_2760_cov_1.463360_2_plen_425_part_00